MALIFGNGWSDAILVIAPLIAIAYFYVKYIYSYWDRRGVESIKPTFPFGNFKKSFLQQASMAEVTQEWYQNASSKFFGFYGGVRPMLFVRDPELIRAICIRDFQHFHDRGVYRDEENDPLSAHLLAMNGEDWKNMRARLSPTFTSGKLKAMFSTLVAAGDPLQRYLAKCSKNNEDVEIREIAARFATNIIASVAFGIDIDCIDNPDNEFRITGRKIFEQSIDNAFRQLLSFIAPKLMRTFKIRSVNKEVENFMMSLVKDNLKYREENSVIRKDFFQLLVQLRNDGKVGNDDQWESTIQKDDKKKTLSIGEVAAQAFIFYAAGFETSSTTISFCLYEVAQYVEVQQKLHEEIDSVLARHDGKITYESASEMKYLEWCIDGKAKHDCTGSNSLQILYLFPQLLNLISETLRKYPPVPAINRSCTKTYKLPGTNVIIEEDTTVMIPAYALHHDEQFYPQPEKFIPERFSDENKKNFVEMPYMPFGEGPRNCIGMRMGKMQTKVGLIAMLQKFRFELTKERMNKKMEFSPKSFLLAPVDGIWVKAFAR